MDFVFVFIVNPVGSFTVRFIRLFYFFFGIWQKKKKKKVPHTRMALRNNLVHMRPCLQAVRRCRAHAKRKSWRVLQTWKIRGAKKGKLLWGKLNSNKTVESIPILSAVYLLQLRRLGCMNKQCSRKCATKTQGSSPKTLVVCVHVNNKADFSANSSLCRVFLKRFSFGKLKINFFFSSWKVKPWRKSNMFKIPTWIQTRTLGSFFSLGLALNRISLKKEKQPRTNQDSWN